MLKELSTSGVHRRRNESRGADLGGFNNHRSGAHVDDDTVDAAAAAAAAAAADDDGDSRRRSRRRRHCSRRHSRRGLLVRQMWLFPH